MNKQMPMEKEGEKEKVMKGGQKVHKSAQLLVQIIRLVTKGGQDIWMQSLNPSVLRWRQAERERERERESNIKWHLIGSAFGVSHACPCNRVEIRVTNSTGMTDSLAMNLVSEFNCDPVTSSQVLSPFVGTLVTSLVGTIVASFVRVSDLVSEERSRRERGRETSRKRESEAMNNRFGDLTLPSACDCSLIDQLQFHRGPNWQLSWPCDCSISSPFALLST